MFSLFVVRYRACVRDAQQVIHYDGDVGEHPPELVMPKKSAAAR